MTSNIIKRFLGKLMKDQYNFCKGCTEKWDCANGKIDHCDLYSDEVRKND